MQTRIIGCEGEAKACAFLQQQGYIIIEQNWRVKGGEIDIIALDGDTIVFAEVKTYPHADIDTLEIALGAIKRKRIVETAKRFINTYRQYSNRYVRFDVLLIDIPRFGDEIYHIVNAFSENI